GGGRRWEIEVRDPGGGRTLARRARAGGAEEGDFEGGADLGLARLPVEPAVERQKLVEGRSLDGRSRQDREVAQRRGPSRRDQDAAAERLVRRDPRTAVGALVMNRVALAHHVGEPLGILLARVLQVALEVHRRDLDRSDDPDVDETRLELEVHRDEDRSLGLPLLVRAGGRQGRGGGQHERHPQSSFHWLTLLHCLRVRGVMKISSSSCFSVRVLLRKRFPRIGIFQRPGIMLFWSWSLIWKMPPITEVPPSRTRISPWYCRTVSGTFWPIERFRATAGSRFWTLTFIRIVPSLVIWGVTVSFSVAST